VYTATPEPVAVNKAAWEALTADQQQVVLAAGERLWERTLAAAEAEPARREKEVAEELTKAGSLTVLPPFSPEDKARFLAAVAEVWQSEAEAVGPEAVAYREQVMMVLQGN
jgi:TRAP-type C4-dicarboxylate transport system substrate-binding protein